MKSIIESRYNLTPQDIYQQTIIQQDKTKLSEELQNNKNSCVFPKDNIDITGIAKQVIQSIDNRQVEITYSIPLKKISADIINKDGSRIEVKNENLPKELGEISDPEVFSSFLKNTYAKITTLSDGEYKLYINHKLLGGDGEYALRVARLIDDLHNQRLSARGVLDRLNIDIYHHKYNNVNESILVELIKLAGAVAFVENVDVMKINSVNFEKVIDIGIYSKQKQLIDNTSYELLFSLANGLEALKNKIFNKEDPFTIHAVKYFFNSVDVQKASDIDIKNRLKDERFVCHTYVNLIARLIQTVNQRFIAKFKGFEIQETPTSEEYTKYNIPKIGFCHGACITIAALEDFSPDKRCQILNRSVYLQGEYHKIRNPNDELVSNLWIEKVINAIKGFEDVPPNTMIPKLIKKENDNFIVNKLFKEFLEESGIQDSENFLSKLYILSRNELQDRALQDSSYKELRTFVNAAPILNDDILKLESLNIILGFLNTKILTSLGPNKHMVLITLQEKVDMSEATNKIKRKISIPQTHDILIRVDTNTEGYITRLIFSDLQETGLHIVGATNSKKNIKEATPQSTELFNFYIQNSALNRFDTISARYVQGNLLNEFIQFS